MEKDIKLIAFDLDGTVLDRGGDITGATAEAFTKAHARGYAFAVATGRGRDIIPPGIMNHPAVDYIISANGAVISERANGKILSVCGIEHTAVVDMIDIARKYRTGVEISYADKSYCEMRCLGLITQYNRGLTEAKGYNTWDEIMGFLEFVRAVKFTHNAKTLVKKRDDAVVKLVVRFKCPEIFESALQDYIADGRMETASTMGTDLEITAKGVTKGRAIATLCSKLEIDKDTVLAFGDSGNDLSMRDFVGTFVAMGNADDTIKAVADCVAPSVSDDGVASVLTELLAL